MELVARLKSLATDGWQRALVIVLGVVLVASAGWTLARFVWLVIEGPASPVVAAPEIVTVAPKREYTPDMARDWRLFGDAAVAPVAPAPGTDAPETRLSLQLLGTFGNGSSKLSGAVIAERGRDGELYRVGAAVPGGATLEKVEGDRVLLRRRGQLETLRFEPLSSATGPAVAGDAPAGGIDTLGGFRALRQSQPSEPGGGAATDGVSRGRELIGSLQEELKADPQAVVDKLGLKTAPGGGYLVGAGTSADAMRALGLRPGDIVVSVNGSSLGDIRKDARLVDEVKASGEARVEVRRGSQTFTVNYPL